MKTGQVTQDFMITRDTLRHYIKEGLLSPKLVKGKYDWSEKDLEDLETILGLRQMGLSLRAISRIKYLHENACSTSEQCWKIRESLRKKSKPAKIKSKYF